MFKQQGYEVKELPDEEDIQTYIDCRGTLKVASFGRSYNLSNFGSNHALLYVNAIYNISGLVGRW